MHVVMHVHTHTDIEEVCRDLVGTIKQHTGENVASMCTRNLFMALCIPDTHHNGGGNFARKMQKNAPLNNYDGLTDRAAAYLKEKRSLDARGAMDRLSSSCLEMTSTILETAMSGVLHEAFTHEEDIEGKLDVWKPTTTQLNGLQNYLSGTGTIVYMHVTHNAGTTILGLAKADGLAMPNTIGSIWNPCSSGDSWGADTCIFPYKDKTFPHTEIADGLVQANAYLESKLDFVSIEHVLPASGPFDTIWGSSGLVFVTTMRHPIGRILAGDGTSGFSEKMTGDYSRWAWSRASNNYNIRCFTGGFQKTVLTRQDLEIAKYRLRQFTVVFILEWLTESLKLACAVLQWQSCEVSQSRKGAHASSRSRFGNDTVYSFLVERNSLDIEFYNYAVELNLKQLRAAGLELPPLEKYTT
jgi:hypothetical protein